ncbi:MAG: macro domain-containing protein [Pseudomonadales bacterium]|jgi:O-acetyl-ADP-ribose deacetylase (regulator of RNase III)
MSTVEIVQADLTALPLDAIVCPAHKHLIRGQGLSARIFDLAGDPLVEECRLLDGCKVGEARLTNAYNLPANKLIHTVTPQWSGGDQWVAKTLELLTQCYESVIKLARENHIRSLGFPALGAGTNKIPHPLAAHQGLAVLEKQAQHFDRLVVCLRSQEALNAWLEAQQKFYAK